MCTICNGTGGVVDNHGWFVKYMPCPIESCNQEAQMRASKAAQQLRDDLEVIMASESA